MTVETLLGFWDGFGNVAVYERDCAEPCFQSRNEEPCYVQLIEKYGKCEVRFFGVHLEEKGLLEIFIR